MRLIALVSTVVLILALVGAVSEETAVAERQSQGIATTRSITSVEMRTRAKCTITGTAKADHLLGTPRDDVICAAGGEDYVRAFGGNDVIYLGKGPDQGYGGPGDDVIYGGQQGDHLSAGAGDDRVYGGPGDDDAGAGGHYPCCGSNLTFDGGKDLLSGGRGNDWCLWVADGTGNDTVRGGPGYDTAMRDKGDQVTAERTNGEGCPG